MLMPFSMALAQSFDEDINNELDQMYDANKRSTRVQSPTAASQVQVNVQSNPSQLSGQTQESTVRVQKQPTTYIEASPLTESRAEKMRKARQDAEVATEQGIVEKLEQARIEDEKKRAERLFGNKFQNEEVVHTPAVVVATPVVVKEEKENHIDKEMLHNEIVATVASMKPEKESESKKMYVGALFGMSDYPNAINVRGQYSMGFAVGQNSESGLNVEGSFIYSNYQVEQREGAFDPFTGEYIPRITDMNQYQGAIAAKYRFFEGTLKPVLGGLMAYTYRSFTDTQFAITSDTTSSQAIDFGLVTGLDLDVAKGFSLGVDFRYMYNLSSRVNKGFQQSYQRIYLRNDTPIEKINYYVLGIVGKATF
jgi:opacity protein-like surface antigen